MDVTPYKLFLKSKPDVSNLGTFGCSAKVMIPADQRGKFAPVNGDGMLLGYAGCSRSSSSFMWAAHRCSGSCLWFLIVVLRCGRVQVKTHQHPSAHLREEKKLNTCIFATLARRAAACCRPSRVPSPDHRVSASRQLSQPAETEDLSISSFLLLRHVGAPPYALCPPLPVSEAIVPAAR
jgi:hypothetical protein